MTPRIVLLVIALLVVVPCASQAAPASGRTPAAARARVSARDSLAMRLKVRTLAGMSRSSLAGRQGAMYERVRKRKLPRLPVGRSAQRMPGRLARSAWQR